MHFCTESTYYLGILNSVHSAFNSHGTKLDSVTTAIVVSMEIDNSSLLHLIVGEYLCGDRIMSMQANGMTTVR